MNIAKPTYTQSKVLDIYLRIMLQECAANAPTDITSKEYNDFADKTINYFSERIIDKLNRPECITEKN